jgi:hypothetical protein
LEKSAQIHPCLGDLAIPHAIVSVNKLLKLLSGQKCHFVGLKMHFVSELHFVKGKSPIIIEFLRNKYFFKVKSPKNV